MDDGVTARCWIAAHFCADADVTPCRCGYTLPKQSAGKQLVHKICRDHMTFRVPSDRVRQHRNGPGKQTQTELWAWTPAADNTPQDFFRIVAKDAKESDAKMRDGEQAPDAKYLESGPGEREKKYMRFAAGWQSGVKSGTVGILWAPSMPAPDFHRHKAARHASPNRCPPSQNSDTASTSGELSSPGSSPRHSFSVRRRSDQLKEITHYKLGALFNQLERLRGYRGSDETYPINVRVRLDE